MTVPDWLSMALFTGDAGHAPSAPACPQSMAPPQTQQNQGVPIVPSVPAPLGEPDAMPEALREQMPAALEADLERWAIQDQDGACWLWLVLHADGNVTQAGYAPPVDCARVAMDYPGATLIPLPGRGEYLLPDELAMEVKRHT
ncbi:hypothetical protein [Chitinilyticum litopenaei]|uniref:hypothetical protein n=1 Tax=Chitinilyticum litopenaei TaxID=1121276 RepID=UPI00048DE6BC|nr:hypothetical protein [Chitinilyticum litopenaei]